MKLLSTIKNYQNAVLILSAVTVTLFTSCEKDATVDTSLETQKTTLRDTVFKDVTYASMTKSLSVPRLQIQTTTIGTKTYFIGGNDFKSSITPAFVHAIDVFDSQTLSWSALPFPSGYDRGSFIVAGSKIFFTGPTTLNSNEAPKKLLRAYDLITNTETSYELNKPRFIEKILISGKEAVFVGGNDIDIINLETKQGRANKLPDDAVVGDAVNYNGFAYFTALNSSKIYTFNITAEIWGTLTPPIKPGAIVISNSKIIAVLKGSRTIYVCGLYYNQTWTAGNLTTNDNASTLIAAGNKVFFANQVNILPNGTGESTNQIEVYDTQTNTSSLNVLSEKRLGMGVAVNGKFVIFGGGYELSTVSPYKVFDTVDFLTLVK